MMIGALHDFSDVYAGFVSMLIKCKQTMKQTMADAHVQYHVFIFSCDDDDGNGGGETGGIQTNVNFIQGIVYSLTLC